MKRFPLLNTYKVLLYVVAVLVPVAGLLVSLGTASVTIREYGLEYRIERDFRFEVFLTTFIPFIIGAFFLAVSAEVIGLFLTIEERLYQIQHNTTPSQSTPQTGSQKGYSDAGISALPTVQPPNISRATVPPADSQAATHKIRATVTAPERALIRPRPNEMAPANRMARSGRDVMLVGRTADGAWVKIDASFDGWINSADLAIQGNIYDLPVVS